MINREDMLELTRRMTPARSSVARIAGAYFDEEGYVDGTFNTNFLKLSPSERSKNLNLAKTILLSETNMQLKDYKIPASARKPGSIWQLLDGIKEAELKNDAFMDIMYELIGEKFQPGYSFACFLYFGQYDVPVKGRDLLCTISRLEGEYEPGKPEFGFLYPAFRNRTEDVAYINVFEEHPGRYKNLTEWMIQVQ